MIAEAKTTTFYSIIFITFNENDKASRSDWFNKWMKGDKIKNRNYQSLKEKWSENERGLEVKRKRQFLYEKNCEYSIYFTHLYRWVAQLQVNPYFVFN